MKTRQYSPRLFNGDIRLRAWHKLPESVKNGLRNIAKNENKTMSWVLEQVIIDYFDLKPPRYKNGKR